MVEITAAVGAVTCNSEVDGGHGKQRAKMGKAARQPGKGSGPVEA